MITQPDQPKQLFCNYFSCKEGLYLLYTDQNQICSITATTGTFRCCYSRTFLCKTKKGQILQKRTSWFENTPVNKSSIALAENIGNFASENNDTQVLDTNSIYVITQPILYKEYSI